MLFTKSISAQFWRSYRKKSIFFIFHFLKFLPYFEVSFRQINPCFCFCKSSTLIAISQNSKGHFFGCQILIECFRSLESNFLHCSLLPKSVYSNFIRCRNYCCIAHVMVLSFISCDYLFCHFCFWCPSCPLSCRPRLFRPHHYSFAEVW